MYCATGDSLKEAVESYKDNYAINRAVAEFEKEYRKLKKEENVIRLVKLATTISAFASVYALSCLAQAGFFKSSYNMTISRVIEIAALLACIVSLTIALTEISYLNKKKIKLHSDADNIINRLQSEKDHNDKNNNHHHDHHNDPDILSGIVVEKFKYEEKIERFEKIIKSLRKENTKEKANRYLSLAASVIFVLVEIAAVIQLYIPFGFDDLHGDLPINLQGIVDMIGLSLIFIGTLLLLPQQIKSCQSTDEKGKTDYKELSLALLPVSGLVINVFGKVIQGMQGAGSIDFLKTEGGQIPLGFMIRMVGVSIIIFVMLYNIYQDLNKVNFLDTTTEIDVNSVSVVGTADTGIAMVGDGPGA